jgi:hypothetical protein
MQSWTCSVCGRIHDEIPTSYGFKAPWPWYTLSASERQANRLLTADYCTIGDADFFVRGCLEIPVLGQEESLIWGIWVSLSQPNFERYLQLRDQPEAVHEPPYFGWLSSRIQVYPDTLLLKARVHNRQIRLRPFVELEPTDHPLAVEQRSGITVGRLSEIAGQMEHRVLHPQWDQTGY